MDDRAFMTLVRLLPKSALSHLVGGAARLRAPPALHRVAMRWFSRHYDVPLHEAEHDFSGYDTFADFFSRRLKPGLRPIASGEQAVVSPVDGVVSQLGYATGDSCVQAKGINFPLEALLGNADVAARYRDGAFATLYLAPRDYHRIHAPLSGHITGFRYQPGAFWPVNPASVRSIPGLFGLNERLVVELLTPAGRCAVIMVGATCVARIVAAFTDITTHQGQPMRAEDFAVPRPVAKGDELGRFEMGSTVIVLLEKGRLRWDSDLQEGSVVRMGQRVGVVT
ncbi:MAG: archaetidylserine decarboxylase [Myxococcaceae bacterium]